MKNGKGMLVLSLCLILLIGMIGCDSGGSNSGGSTTTTTTTVAQTPQMRLVGTWNFVSSTDGIILGKLIYGATTETNGSGTWNGSPFSGGRIDNGVLFFTLSSGQPEAFDIAWSNNNNTIRLTNHNGGAAYTYNRQV